MPRFKEHEAVYDVFQQFLQRCLVADRSLLWPSREAWTPEKVKAVFDRIAGNPLEDNPDTDFWEKLDIQMDNATREEWMVLADTLYVYHLPSKSLLHKTRTGRIQWAVEQGQLSPPEDQRILENREIGFCHTGLYFNMKYRQVMSILGIGHYFKRQSREERQHLIENHKVFSAAVSAGIEQVPEPAHRAADIGPAFLYMGFPDYFEPIINLTDRRKIVRELGDRLDEPRPDDIDEALYKIRQSLEDEYPTAEGEGETLHYYLEPIRSLWQSPQAKAVPEIPKDEEEEPIDRALPDVPSSILKLFHFTRNVILYGPPGTGKTYLAGRIAELSVRTYLGRENVQTGSSSAPRIADWRDFIEWVTFHQSYAYEDFIEGLRPVTSEDSPGDISYDIVPGVFRRLCERAAADPDNRYILIIDEINRGNIAKILGELITLLEDDKRGQTVTLPYSQTAFAVPANLYVIGTMNTADRSIALLDMALRRRFAFYELMPDAGLLGDMVIEQGNLRFRLSDLLRNLNNRIAGALGRDHTIGHSYLMKVKGDGPEDDSAEARIERLTFIWNHQILPMLREYFYSQPEQLEKMLQITEEQSLEEAAFEGEDLLAMLEAIAGHHEA